jgi:hypothetical protein
MAKKRVVVFICDRHEGEIDTREKFFHFDVTDGRKAPGRRAQQSFDLCAKCMEDFLKFLEGSEQGLTANQRVAEGMI